MIGVAVFVLVGLLGLFWLAYRQPRPRRWLLPRRAVVGAAEVASAAAVDRQHRHLQAGGMIGEAAFAMTRTRFQELLATGRAAEIEVELRPGLEFAVRVQALAAIGNPDAAALLERQLVQRLTPDPVEQAWYWIDVAQALRRLNRTAALPAVLHCANDAERLHQGVILAAEAIAFPNFPATLHDLTSADGRLAVRVLARAARGCREARTDPSALLRVGLGDHLAAVCETAPPAADPWLAEAVLEAERLARRLGHWARLLADDVRSQAERQAARLEAIAGRRGEWLSGAAVRLVARFPQAQPNERAAILRCLAEFRADAADLFTGLPHRREPWWPEAVQALAFAKGAAFGPLLSRQAAALFGARTAESALAQVLEALRGHRCPEAESVLLRAAASPRPVLRRAAFAALGWSDPFDTNAMIPQLRSGRSDPDAASRRAAVAALARLGERAALLEFAEALASEEPAIRQAAALAVAEEGMSWLWPDVQALAEAADPETALVACEALERMRERTLGLHG